MRENVIANGRSAMQTTRDAMPTNCSIEKQQSREAAMLGILAGLIAFFGMSAAVVIGATILYDPERSYHHH